MANHRLSAKQEPADDRMALPASRERADGDRQFASTLERGLRVLQCFSADRPELGNTEIAHRTGLPKPTVSRLTHTLVQLGYLRRDPEAGTYRLGLELLSLSYPLLAGLELRRLAAEPMLTLADSIDGAVAISVRDRLRIISIENVVTRDVLRRKPGAGISSPLLPSTPGWCWLIAATPEERQRAIEDIERAQPGAWDAQAETYGLLRRECIRHGYITRRNAMRQHTSVLAAALRPRPDGELLILSCALSIAGGNPDALEARAGQALMRAARRIGDLLHGNR